MYLIAPVVITLAAALPTIQIIFIAAKITTAPLIHLTHPINVTHTHIIPVVNTQHAARVVITQLTLKYEQTYPSASVHV